MARGQSTGRGGALTQPRGLGAFSEEVTEAASGGGKRGWGLRLQGPGHPPRQGLLNPGKPGSDLHTRELPQAAAEAGLEARGREASQEGLGTPASPRTPALPAPQLEPSHSRAQNALVNCTLSPELLFLKLHLTSELQGESCPRASAPGSGEGKGVATPTQRAVRPSPPSPHFPDATAGMVPGSVQGCALLCPEAPAGGAVITPSLTVESLQSTNKGGSH